MAVVHGTDILVKQLKNEGVEIVFNVPGDPNGKIFRMAMPQAGIRVINHRHEQGAALAAQAYAYTSRKLGVCLVPSGPAMTNAITSLATAWANCWPLLLISGSTNRGVRYRGDFQEMPQVEGAAPYCKLSCAIEDVKQIPYYVHTAILRMLNGRPMPVYLDLPSNVIDAPVEEDEVTYYPAAAAPARPLAEPELVRKAVKLIDEARRPLLLVGKGAAWSDAGDEACRLVEQVQMPFVPSPMGKGLIPDDHPLNAQSARSCALLNADLVLLVGARFNWVFHFGQSARFAPGVKVIQIDIEPEEISNGVQASVGLSGDAKMVLSQILDSLGNKKYPARTEWSAMLEAAKRSNAEDTKSLLEAPGPHMNMYQMYREVVPLMDRDAYVTADGENNMAMSRVMVPNYLPRHRVDAGTSGCMGTAVPHAIGVKMAFPDKQVFSFNGDFAIGWNIIELETAARNKLEIVFMVGNNVSVGGPQAIEFLYPYDESKEPEGIRYDKIMETFGGHGEFVQRPEQIRPALERSLAAGKPALINVAIGKQKIRKKQAFDWMSSRDTREKY